MKRLNFYEKPEEDHSVHRSYWTPNWEVDVVVTKNGSFIQRLSEKEFVDCDPLTSKYYPVLFVHNER